MWLFTRFSRSLKRYSAASPVSRRLATMRISLLCSISSSRYALAVSSSTTFSTRSSVVRQTREISEVKTIAPMKNEAILMPSGCSMTLTTVV